MTSLPNLQVLDTLLDQPFITVFQAVMREGTSLSVATELESEYRKFWFDHNQKLISMARNQN